MQKIVPHLWFDKEAQQAITQYTQLFAESHIQQISNIQDTPSGDVSIFAFQLAKLDFQAINAGPYFKFNESISLFVSVDSAEEVDWLYHALVEDGKVLMPLDTYDFCPRYAWVADRYGLNWQLMFNSEKRPIQKIRMGLLFSMAHCGLAEAAINEYSTIFKNVQKGEVSYYKPGEAADPAAKINYAELHLDGLDLVVMDHGYSGIADFNEAISFMVLCEDQAEIDYYWERLSFDPEAEQCGWLKDRFGVSWQIVPRNMGGFIQGPPDAVNRVTQAFLSMKKFDLAALDAAFKGTDDSPTE